MRIDIYIDVFPSCEHDTNVYNSTYQQLTSFEATVREDPVKLVLSAFSRKSTFLLPIFWNSRHKNQPSVKVPRWRITCRPVFPPLWIHFFVTVLLSCVSHNVDNYITPYRAQNNLRVATTREWISEQGIPLPRRISNNQIITPLGPRYHDFEYFRLIGTFTGAFIFLNIIAAAAFSVAIARASQRLHDIMFARTLYVVTQFFNFHPSGQILNKFSKDVSIIDIDLNRAFFDFSRVSSRD